MRKFHVAAIFKGAVIYLIPFALGSCATYNEMGRPSARTDDAELRAIREAQLAGPGTMVGAFAGAGIGSAGAYNRGTLNKRVAAAIGGSAGAVSGSADVAEAKLGSHAQRASAGAYPVSARTIVPQQGPPATTKYQKLIESANERNRSVQNYNGRLARKVFELRKKKSAFRARSELASASNVQRAQLNRIKLRKDLVKQFPEEYTAAYQETISNLKKEIANLETAMADLRAIISSANRASLAAAENSRAKEN